MFFSRISPEKVHRVQRDRWLWEPLPQQTTVDPHVLQHDLDSLPLHYLDPVILHYIDNSPMSNVVPIYKHALETIHLYDIDIDLVF